MSTSKKYPKPHPQTAGRVIDGEAVVILADSSEVNVLNPVGSRIFELADGSHSVEDVIEVIVAEYNISPEQAAADVNEFLKKLVEQSVLIFGETKEQL